MPLLPFISDEDLKSAVSEVIDKANAAIETAEEKIHVNAIDPFSAVFDASCLSLDYEEWLKKEKSRQIQKTLQNAIGDFHENIIGSLPGWVKLPVGNVIDNVGEEKRIITEIKNKHNTTKGSDKKQIYDNLESQLALDRYDGFKAYYVEIIPKNKRVYDKPFTPPDNVTGTNRPEREDIRVIDGKSFYKLASDHDNALHLLYKALPEVISEILNDPDVITRSSAATFEELFSSTYDV